MRKININWKNTIFTRLLITFFIIIIPLYILGVSIYSWAINTVRLEISNSMGAQAGAYISDLENDIKRIRTLMFDCIGDADLNDLSNAYMLLTDIEKRNAINKLQQRLSIIKNSSSNISNVSVHISGINRVISATGGTRQTIDEISQEEFNALLNFDYVDDSQITNYKDQLLMCVVFPQIVEFDISKKHKSPLFIIEIELSKIDLQRSLTQFTYSKESGALLIDFADRYIIGTMKNSLDQNYLHKVLIENGVNKSTSILQSIEFNNKRYLVITSPSKYINMTFCRYISEDEMYKPLKKYRFWFWIFTSIAFTSIILYMVYTYGLIHKPLYNMVDAFKKVEKGDLIIQIEHKHKDEFSYIYKRFNVMVENLNTLIDQVYKQKILMQHTELKQLQAQINPHFLYNSFYLLNRMVISEDNENASKFSRHLGNYFKFVTRNASDEELLEKEVEHARIYTDIQSMRFVKSLKVDFQELPESMRKIFVPRLILQPVIENAFEHGLKSKQKDGLLNINFQFCNSKIMITIEDNGEEISDSKIFELQNDLCDYKYGKETTGIINIHKRIQLKYGEESGIELERGLLGGLKVTIHIELK